MAKRGFGFVVAAAIVIGLAAGAIVAIIVATRQNHQDVAKIVIDASPAPIEPVKQVVVAPGDAAVDAPPPPPPERAKPSESKVAAEDPRDKAEKLNGLGKEAMFHEDYAGSERYFRDAHALIKSSRYAFNMATAQFQEGKFSEALAAIAIARGDKPDSVLAGKLDSLESHIRQEVKAQHVRTADVGNVTRANELNEQGRQELKAARPEQAAKLFESAHGLSPDPKYSFNTALAYELREDYVTEMKWLRVARSEGGEPTLVEKIEARIKKVSAILAANQHP